MRSCTASALLFLVLVGCDPADPAPPTRDLRVTVERDGDTLRLSHSVHEAVTRGDLPVIEAELVWSWSSMDSELAVVSEGALVSDSLLALVDGRTASAHLLDLRSGATREFASRGQGPGELQRPYGVAVSGSEVLVHDPHGTPTIGRYDLDGGYLGPLPVGDSLDLPSLPFTSPLFNFNGQQMGVEPSHMRIRGTGSGVMIIEMEDVRLLAALSSPTPASGWLHWEDTASEGAWDTTTFPQLRDAMEVQVSPLLRTVVVELFGRRILADGSGDLRVWTLSDESAVTIQGAGATSAVTWPAAARPVTEEDMLEAGWWRNAGNAQANELVLSRFLRFGRSVYEEAAAFEVEQNLRFASTHAETSDLRVVGRCLLLAPVSPSANPWGIAASYLVLNLDQDEVVGIGMIPDTPMMDPPFEREGRLVVDHHKDLFLSLHVDELGISILELHRIPVGSCRPQSGSDGDEAQ